MKNKLAFLMVAVALGLAPAVRADGLLQRGCKKDCAPACAPKCPKQKCDTCGKSCVPSTEKKIVEHREYSSACEQYCTPRCSLGGMLRGGCGKKPCDPCNACPAACEECHKCGKVRTRKVLIVKIRKEEECVNTC